MGFVLRIIQTANHVERVELLSGSVICPSGFKRCAKFIIEASRLLVGVRALLSATRFVFFSAARSQGRCLPSEGSELADSAER